MARIDLVRSTTSRSYHPSSPLAPEPCTTHDFFLSLAHGASDVEARRRRELRASEQRERERRAERGPRPTVSSAARPPILIDLKKLKLIQRAVSSVRRSAAFAKAQANGKRACNAAAAGGVVKVWRDLRLTFLHCYHHQRREEREDHLLKGHPRRVDPPSSSGKSIWSQMERTCLIV